MRWVGPKLFLVSFLSLFLELLIIRWVPSHMRVMAYYGNLMLLSSFLGLGCGTLLSRRSQRLFRWFPLALLLLVAAVFFLKRFEFYQGPEELRFLLKGASSSSVLPVILIFGLNGLVFIPLGNLLGFCFQQIPSLRAYSWDLSGAITGTALFGLFSYFWFSPILGLATVMTLYLVLCENPARAAISAALFAPVLIGTLSTVDPFSLWSPYYYITVHEILPDGRSRETSAPPNNITTMKNPPAYIVNVNQDFYQVIAALDVRRYTQKSAAVSDLNEQFFLPHQVRPQAEDVLVVGSGSGKDVEAALLAGAGRIDAVEIDPVLIHLSRQLNPSQPYRDRRVTLHNTDARAFFRQTSRRYDMVIFGFLDSQGLFSHMSNIRLDGYVYTQESIKEALALLKQGGLLSLSFYTAGKGWLADRLIAMMRSATRQEPLIFVKPSGQVILLAGKGFRPVGLSRYGQYRAIGWTGRGTPEALDDWPYLYLQKRFIPPDYLVIIGALLVLSFSFIALSSGQIKKGLDWHFFFLGAGFLLLETKSIATISLYFGTTWLVSMIVILGVLIMALLANIAAAKLDGFHPAFYFPLAASVAFLYFFPDQKVLEWSPSLRLAYSLAVIPLPIFFAGLIFSLTFRDTRDASFSFGSNLLGAMVGGFTEYLGMITGMKTLLLLVLLFYACSCLSFLQRAKSVSAPLLKSV